MALYPCFNHWEKDFQTIWIYSDPHFSDPDLAYYRPSDEEQIRNINAKAGKKDILICLGDVGDTEKVKQLKAGYKVLILGNHDKGVDNYKRKITFHTENIDSQGREWGYHIQVPEDNKLFDEVYAGPLMINDKIILSHEPLPNLLWALNICGHDHNARKPDLDANHYCVCGEAINYTPINLTHLMKKGLTANIESIHRATIEKAKIKKELRGGKKL